MNSVKYDYLQDAVFSGLTKILGKENLRMVPFNKNFAFERKAYPRNMGHSKGWTLSHLKKLFFGFQYDLVILGAAKESVFQQYLQILPAIEENIPILFLDGGDMAPIGGDLDRTGGRDVYDSAMAIRPATRIFKREYLKDTEYGTEVMPCPFAINFDKLPNTLPARKKYDVSFWAVESHEIRTRALQLIQDKYDCRENGTTLSQEFRKYARKGLFYLEELSRTKVVLNFRGGGWDTLRFWETPALSTFMISGRPGIVFPDDFTEDVNIVYCNDTLDDLIPKIDYYLSNEKHREEIAFAGFKHVSKYHSDIARAKYILQHAT